MEKKYNGLKSICDAIFTLISVGTVFWNPDFSVLTAIVLFTQNIMVCYNNINIDNSKRLFFMNIVAIVIDGISLFLVIGYQMTEILLLANIVKISSLMCLGRAVIIFAHYVKILKPFNEEVSE